MPVRASLAKEFKATHIIGGSRAQVKLEPRIAETKVIKRPTNPLAVYDTRRGGRRADRKLPVVYDVEITVRADPGRRGDLIASREHHVHRAVPI
jgi:hypothetical protein